MTFIDFSMLLAQGEQAVHVESNANSEAAAVAVIGGFIFICFLFSLVLSIIALVGLWKMFTKAGKPGWAAIIPVYNVIVMIEMADRPLWWIILFFIPVANLVVSIVVMFDISRKFGRGIGTALGLVFLNFIFFPILGFGSAQYNADA